MSDNTQTIYIVERPPESTSDEEHFEKMFPSKAVTILAVLQIVAGSLAFISEVFQVLVLFKPLNVITLGPIIFDNVKQ